MAQQWFKFYGGEWMNDPKRLALNAPQQNCWIMLMCYASQADDGGRIKHLTEERLMVQSGIDFASGEWDITAGVLEKLVKLDMITIDNETITLLNWNKRQEKSLTPYERVKRYREKAANDNADNGDDNGRVEKSRVEENRERKPHASISYLKEIPEADIKELAGKFEASQKQIQRKAEQMMNYCVAKGKIYKNYRAFLENGLDKDFGRRVLPKIVEIEKSRPMTPDEKAHLEKLKVDMRARFSTKQK